MQAYNKKYWPYQIRLDWNKIQKQGFDVSTLERFCYESFRSADWHNKGYYFVFKQESDATFFALKWN